MQTVSPTSPPYTKQHHNWSSPSPSQPRVTLSKSQVSGFVNSLVRVSSSCSALGWSCDDPRQTEWETPADCAEAPQPSLQLFWLQFYCHPSQSSIQSLMSHEELETPATAISFSLHKPQMVFLQSRPLA